MSDVRCYVDIYAFTGLDTTNNWLSLGTEQRGLFDLYPEAHTTTCIGRGHVARPNRLHHEVLSGLYACVLGMGE